MNEQQVEVRDNRSKDWFYLDNEILDNFGGKDDTDKGIGCFAIAVYSVLARHANNDTQQCWPSYNGIARILNISRNTVIRAIETLEKEGLISVEQRVSHKLGKPTTSNIYTLLKVEKAGDKTPSSPQGIGAIPPSALGASSPQGIPIPPGVPKQDSVNKTNKNKTNKREADEPSPTPEIIFVEDYYRVRFPNNKPPNRNWILEHSEQFGQKAVLVGIAKARARSKPAPHYIAAIVSTLSPDELERYDDYGTLIPTTNKITNISRQRTEPATTRQWSAITQRAAGKTTG